MSFRRCDRILQYLRITPVTTGRTLHAHRARIKDVYFPNGGVLSVTIKMRDGPLVEVATVGREGMLGIGVFFGDPTGIGRTFQQVANGPLPSMRAARFVKETAIPGPFRDVVNLYAQANLLQIMRTAPRAALIRRSASLTLTFGDCSRANEIAPTGTVRVRDATAWPKFVKEPGSRSPGMSILLSTQPRDRA
jgi:hypothetical protein